ncbi:hypothetical protein BUZ44_06930 [Staphylococcus haemolyticus]|nr:hypothetical protein BUZ44_06930 [Staphylococcus haemolyticus]PTK73730.1 hypothetical protein BUZ29_04425 [Staphylococcus haemolyticus]
MRKITIGIVSIVVGSLFFINHNYSAYASEIKSNDKVVITSQDDFNKNIVMTNETSSKNQYGNVKIEYKNTPTFEAKPGDVVVLVEDMVVDLDIQQ